MLKILCFLLTSSIVLSEDRLYKNEFYDKEQSILERSYPEIQLFRNRFNNVTSPYDPSISDSSRKLAQINDFGKDLNSFITLWKYQVSDLLRRLANNSTLHKCNLDLLYMLFNIDKLWTISMLDAFGKPSPGILRGAVRWLGNYEECQEVVVPKETIGTITFGGFSGHQCLIQWSSAFIQKNRIQFTQSACLPNSCDSTNLENEGGPFLELINEIIFGNATNNSIIKIGNVDCSDHRKSWTGPDIAYTCILAIFCTLIFTSTLCDIWDEIQSKKGNAQSDNTALNINESLNDIHSVVAKVDVIEGQYKGESSDSIVVKKNTNSKYNAVWLKELLKCFSVYTNGAKVINVGNQKGQLSCLHGIRFLSMTWIILGHTALMFVTSSDNPVDIIKLFLNSFSLQVIYQGTYAVDTFFFLSGFLLTYLFLKEYDGSDKKFNWIYYYLHRIWRLSPVFYMLVGFLATLWLHLGTGPLWPLKEENGNCEKYWWWDILYILNFKDNKDMCMSWAWYLANDMQFYVISPLFLLFLWKLPIIGNLLVGIVMIASWITTGVISANNNLEKIFESENTNNNPENNIRKLSQEANIFDLIYSKPYCRIGPYLVGIFVGYAFHKANTRKFIKKWMVVFGWLVSLFLLGIVIFGVYRSNMGKATAAAYNALSRTAWGIGVGWIVFACLTGYGGPIDTLLSWKAWVPLSRLTYCAYLVHPMILSWYTSSLHSILHFEITTVVMYYFGFLLCAYLAAFIVTLAFESPMMALEKFLLKHFSRN